MNQKSDKIAGGIYVIHRILILLACMCLFLPQVNPGRITTEISKYCSLFTTGISYKNLTMNLGRPLRMGWISNSTIYLLMAMSIVMIIGIVLCGIGGCMSMGNTRMKKKGIVFPIIGSVLMFAGLAGIYVSYIQIKNGKKLTKVPPNFSNGFYIFAGMAALILVFSIFLAIRQRKLEAEDKMNMDEQYKIFLYMLPILALAFVFSYLPLYGWRYAFFDYTVGGELTKDTFVGFKWFTYLFENAATRKDIIRVMRNTLVMSGLGIATSWLPVAFAILLSEIRSIRFRKCVQILTTIPNFISWVLVYAIALAMFSTDGFINSAIEMITNKAVETNYLMSSSGIWLKMLLWGIWKGIGWSAIVYIAAIAGIDQQMHEAAMIDGAGRFKRIWYITVPSLMPTYCVMLMLSVANVLSNGMEQYMVFENAMNKDTIEVLDYYVYNLGIGSGQISLSSVVSMAKSIISVILLFSANKISKMVRGESII